MSVYDFQPPDDEELDLLLGPEPEFTEPEPEEFQATPWQRILEGFQGIDAPRPRNFLEGLVVGGSRGLAQQGQRVAQARQKFEQAQAGRARTLDAQRLKAAEARAGGKRDIIREAYKTHATTKKERDKYLLGHRKPSPDELKEQPWLARYADPEGLVPVSEIGEAFKPKKEPRPDKERIVAIETPDGPRYVRESQALGQRPSSGREAKTPTATEREHLSIDIGMLDQIKNARGKFKRGFVGPISGRLGTAGQRVGLTKEGESSFRAAMAGIRNQILKARSGGAVTEGEARRLLKELPTENDPSGVFEDKLNEFERAYRTLAATRREVLEGAGMDLSRMPTLPGVSVTAPNGKTYTFKDQASANAFKKRAGM